jgi:hypothetical protein
MGFAASIKVTPRRRVIAIKSERTDPRRERGTDVANFRTAERSGGCSCRNARIPLRREAFRYRADRKRSALYDTAIDAHFAILTRFIPES